MAYPEVIELFDSGSGGLTFTEQGDLEREVTLRWLVSNKKNYLEAETWATAYAPLYQQGHRRARLDIRGLGNSWWEVSAQYSNASVQSDERSPDTPSQESGGDGISGSISFDTTAGTGHITQALGQRRYAKAGATAPDTEGAIDIEGDQVRGVDVTVPGFTFSETWTFPSASLVAKYLGTIYSLTGKVNDAKWRIFNAGEVLFLGARGQADRGATTCQVTFSFSASPNESELSVGGVSGIKKDGWEYMTVTYEAATSQDSIIKKPKFVYVNQVYGSADFTQLKIGGAGFPEVWQPKLDFGGKK